MKLVKITFLVTVCTISYVTIHAMDQGRGLPPCDISAVEYQPSTRVRHIEWDWEPPRIPSYWNQEPEEFYLKRKEEEKALRQAALKERRFLASGTMKSLQKASANTQIESLLQNLDDVESVQEAIRSYPLAIKTLLLDQIEAQKELLDVDNAEELKKIKELNTLETLVNQALEEESKEIQENSPEKEEKLD